MTKPPVAEKRPHTVSLHGETWEDPWFWLREKENPDVIALLEAENAYYREKTAHTLPLQKALYDEMLARIQEDDSSVPVRKGPWSYYSRTVEGKPYGIYCRKPAEGGEEQVLLDMNAEAEGFEFFQLGAFAISPDHRFLAYTTDTDGSERYVLRVRDLSTGEEDPHTVADLKWNIAWASDNATLFYTLSDKADRPYKVMRHRLGTPASDDVEVFHEPDERFFVGVGRSKDGQFVIIDLESKITSEVWLVDATAPDTAPKVVTPREQGMEYSVTPLGDTLYICTNADGATNFKLMKTSTASTGRAQWTEVVAHRPEILLVGVEPFRDHLVLLERPDGLPSLRVLDLASGASRDIRFDEATWALDLGSNPELDAGFVRFSFESPRTPSTVIDCDLRTLEQTVRKVQPVLGGFDRENYETARVYATAPDGVKVPISLVYRKDTPRDGSAPMLLNGYGSYGIDYDANFATTKFSLLDRGWVCGIAHIRGGGELGRPWYEAGKFLTKKTTFTDFVACARYLADEGWTSSERLAAWGGSAGGLLMGASLNLDADAFGAVVARVPFVDVIHTMIDPELPLTVIEWEEWGNPLHDPEYFTYMRSYAPYDNVSAKAYPPLYITAGLNDPRVGYWEPAKWAQKLRELKTDDNPVYLDCEMGAGHGGKTGRYGRLEDTSRAYAFLLDTLGEG
ncbi:MAG: S9 family peptidase [Deltaproteobacteria bacterium]|nr:MAG: S9 family peptidase [Deltaproteobacteria bacterium]